MVKPAAAAPGDDARDAARYRWWLERYFSDDDSYMDEIHEAFRNIGYTKPEVDAAIDKAMQRTKGSGG